MLMDEWDLDTWLLCIFWLIFIIEVLRDRFATWTAKAGPGWRVRLLLTARALKMKRSGVKARPYISILPEI